MTYSPLIKKIKDKIDKDELKLFGMINETERIWEDTGLDPKDPSYLIEKTMRFELAQKNITSVFSLFNEIIADYKKLGSEMAKPEES